MSLKSILSAGVSRIALSRAMPERNLERERALTKAARKMARKIRPKLKQVARG